MEMRAVEVFSYLHKPKRVDEIDQKWYKFSMSQKMKPVGWIGSSYKDFIELPISGQAEMGYALYLAQIGTKSDKAKPLKGFSGAGILEVIDDYAGARIELFIQSEWKKRCMYCMHSKRNQNAGLQHLKLRST